MTAKYLVAVSRLGFGQRTWFISGADIDDDAAGSSFFGGGGPRLYDTGSGKTQVLASP